ncbi:MAG: UDP-N-acetylmuramoyl-tripeptide--D-alanyl-D-alanine ligase [Candidatus Omnitrophota bacterium]
MIRLTVKDIARATGGELFSEDAEAVVSGFSVDSRTIKRGQIFIAIGGSKFNGHDFIRDAAEKHASGLIVEHSAGAACRGLTEHVVCVENTRWAMGMIAREIRKRASIPVICITGTNGKTTVKDILSHILSARHNVLRSEKSYNNIIGVSLTLFDMDPSHDVAVVELGANHPGEISKLAGIAGPQTAIITNIGDAHLEGFIDREGVFAEKISLLDSLPAQGTVFLNKDDRMLAMADTGGIARKYYGTSPDCDFKITDLAEGPDGYDFYLNEKSFFLPMEGVHNVYNAAAAIAAAACFGMDYEEIRKSLKEVSLPKMRLEKLKIEGLLFINDAYNANPGSFECALEVLQHSASGGGKGVVAGDMMELGDKSDELHRIIGRNIAGKDIDFLITLGSRARHIAEGAIETGMEKDRVLCAESHEDAARMIWQVARPEAVVLLKGSRAAKMEEVLKCFTMSCIL